MNPSSSHSTPVPFVNLCACVSCCRDRHFSLDKLVTRYRHFHFDISHDTDDHAIVQCRKIKRENKEKTFAARFYYLPLTPCLHVIITYSWGAQKYSMTVRYFFCTVGTYSFESIRQKYLLFFKSNAIEKNGKPNGFHAVHHLRSILNEWERPGILLKKSLNWVSVSLADFVDVFRWITLDTYFPLDCVGKSRETETFELTIAFYFGENKNDSF